MADRIRRRTRERSDARRTPWRATCVDPWTMGSGIFIDVVSCESTRQARTYAEYRFFAALVKHARRIRTVRVRLARSADADTALVSCSVDVVLENAGGLHADATGPQAYAAIDDAAERIDGLMNRG